MWRNRFSLMWFPDYRKGMNRGGGGSKTKKNQKDSGRYKADIQQYRRISLKKLNTLGARKIVVIKVESLGSRTKERL